MLPQGKEKGKRDMAEATQNDRTQKWGRIFMDNKVSDLDSLERRRSLAWSEKDQAEYLERVRQKAEDKAREILRAAQSEANALRIKAREEGYAEGARQAEAELAELRSSLGDTVHTVLDSIEKQAAGIYAAQRENLCALVRLAVEKGLGITLAAERGAVLESLFNEAVESLESARRITVRCNPEDAAALEDIIAMGHEKYPDMKAWKVHADQAVEPGGILVESESSLANNTIESRRAAVDKVLAGLNIPAEQPPA